jgi:anaerobic ribonucleoside-triphosphate reductase
MFENIKKRDGRVMGFDSSKIKSAILKAGNATGEFGEREAKKLTLRVLTLAHDLRLGPIPEVEEIQDIVERILLDSPYYKSSKAYILYREQHAQIRAIATKASVDLVENYIRKLDWKISENSNMRYSLQGLNNYISSDITCEYWLNRIYPPKIRRAHKNGDFHIHDLSLLSVYCVGWDLKDLLKQGFKGVEGKVESAPPRHLRSALGQIVNFFYTLQGEAAGAQAISNFDTLLAPFVRYDNLSDKGVKQALQEFVFNINIPTRVGFQTPFTNITMDLHVPAILKDQPVIIGGNEGDETYSEFQPEMDVINRAFAEVMIEGDVKGRVFTFPIPTYNITADFDWDNPNLEMIWKMTGKYGIPYFSNFVNSDMSPEDARSMCCRLRLDNRELLKRGGGLFGANPLTGSIGVVTINLPRIGYLSENEDDFFGRLKEMMLLAKESLSIKRKVLEKFTDKNLYPYSKFYLREI